MDKKISTNNSKKAKHSRSRITIKDPTGFMSPSSLLLKKMFDSIKEVKGHQDDSININKKHPKVKSNQQDPLRFKKMFLMKNSSTCEELKFNSPKQNNMSYFEKPKSLEEGFSKMFIKNTETNESNIEENLFNKNNTNESKYEAPDFNCKMSEIGRNESLVSENKDFSYEMFTKISGNEEKSNLKLEAKVHNLNHSSSNDVYTRKLENLEKVIERKKAKCKRLKNEHRIFIEKNNKVIQEYEQSIANSKYKERKYKLKLVSLKDKLKDLEFEIKDKNLDIEHTEEYIKKHRYALAERDFIIKELQDKNDVLNEKYYACISELEILKANGEKNDTGTLGHFDTN
ncbi:hypothetical protein SteCoe_26324 [Stentor coeruleus]|uniref:Uncharacterized protein n=1 Tax=Stentor coeruleus TaxID=5963 RepID=A0A1R2BD45_9CILI|nr:hypothetical protein SteCoe_26324 [Stentor coeruleus]